MKRYEINIQGGTTVVKATIVVNAMSKDHAEEMADRMAQAMDSSCYVNTVYEMA